MIEYNERYISLNNSFILGKNSYLDNTKIKIQFFDFNSQVRLKNKRKILNPFDTKIAENFTFKYPVFVPTENMKSDKAVLLLHGLNERHWNKYLTWAEYLCENLGVPIILFPLAYHINRSPMEWSNPRKMSEHLNHRRELYAGDRTISYANIALSERISEEPSRFYLSGRQTLQDITQLFELIKKGHHPLFKKGTAIDIFAYSIGAFLGQTALIANQKKLFTSSRLFMFCGGSILSSMFGVSRSILDQASFQALREYYLNTFGNEKKSLWKKDEIFSAFKSMLLPDNDLKARESVFSRLNNRVGGIALAKDKVIPYHGVQEAMGSDNASSSVRLLDFPFNYTHENPFPTNVEDTHALNKAFDDVFSSAVYFLS